MNARQMIAENIRRARRMKKISRRDLSCLTRIPDGKIKSFERGDEFQETALVRRIANALNIGIEFFYQLPDEGFDKEKILLRRNKLPKRDREAVIEMARYKSKDVTDLVIVMNLPVFQAPPKEEESISHERARELGERLASKWYIEEETLSSILESNGNFVVRIPDETILFRGLFIYRKNIPIIAIYEKDRKDGKLVEDISHELGHAVFLNQKLPQDLEEKLCDSFAEGFSEKISALGIATGEFDFIRRGTVKAWIDGEISSSRAAEIFGITTSEFIKEFSA